jgi:uncharacterized protein YajQ (UPF0234 family)
MAGESSFDVVSDFDDMEMRNALDQVGARCSSAMTSRASRSN